MGDAFAWASQIIAIGLAMFLPAVAGNWLDARFGTRFLGAAGLVFGVEQIAGEPGPLLADRFDRAATATADAAIRLRLGSVDPRLDLTEDREVSDQVGHRLGKVRAPAGSAGGLAVVGPAGLGSGVGGAAGVRGRESVRCHGRGVFLF
jgi:hypothetical protein